MRIRKAILTGGGRATRLYPITTTTNKHLLPLANKPMIFHAIEKAVEAGVDEIFINVNPGETDLQKYIGDGGHWNIKIKFFEQRGGPQGIAHVVKEAQDFISNEPFLFYLSDNIILGGIKDTVDEFNQGKYDCLLALAEVPDPQSFGVPLFNENKELIDVLEKPANPPNNFAVAGIYLYGPKVFFKAFDNIARSARGEYEISSIHSYLFKNNHKVGYKEITGWWKDTGLAGDFFVFNKFFFDKLGAPDFPNHGAVDPGTQIIGKVRVGIGSRVAKGVKIVGPVIIAENCILENCEVGPYVTVGQGTEIKQAKINNSIILENCEINCDIKITGSLIGKGVKIIKKHHQAAEGHRMVVGDK